jgi:hypothetical protein
MTDLEIKILKNTLLNGQTVIFFPNAEQAMEVYKIGPVKLPPDETPEPSEVAFEKGFKRYVALYNVELNDFVIGERFK